MPNRRCETEGIAGLPRMPGALARQTGRGRVEGGERTLRPDCHLAVGGRQGPGYGYKGRPNAVGRGCKPPQANLDKHHQHTCLASIRPQAKGLRTLGIPYQCFIASVLPCRVGLPPCARAHGSASCAQEGASTSQRFPSECSKLEKSSLIKHLHGNAGEKHYRR
jgi:hypothetical protein